MTTDEIAQGQDRAWNLLKKLGEGDAGEVILVESVLEKQVGILKRPQASSFPSDIVRQAAQIEREAQILTALNRFHRSTSKIKIPELLDQSKAGTGLTERFFIIIKQAPGIDLGSIGKFIHFGVIEEHQSSISRDSDFTSLEFAYLEEIIKIGLFPDLILLQALSSLYELFDSIHTLEISTASARYYGIIWNDVKPEHIYWDPLERNFTIIDWGNSQFLRKDGSSQDQHSSRMDDYMQLLEGFGRFLLVTNPGLHKRLRWPNEIEPGNLYASEVLPLKEKANSLLIEESAKLVNLRQSEKEIIHQISPKFAEFHQLTHLQKIIISMGELPDYAGAEKFIRNLGNELLSQNELVQLQELCYLASNLPTLGTEKCRLLAQLAEVSQKQNLPARALLAGLSDDWPSALWEIRKNNRENQEAAWWVDISNEIRQIELSPLAIRPLVAVNRLIHALASEIQNETNSSNPKSPSPTSSSPQDSHIITLLQKLREYILPRWIQLEPDPPESGLKYQEIAPYIDSILSIAPEIGEMLHVSLEQPRAIIALILDAWERKDFTAARRGLRQLLLWDPDRPRVLLADHAFQSAPAWLAVVRAGPEMDEPLQEFVTRVELEGRDFRNQVGPASWLDALLTAFSYLRKGTDPTEVLMGNPEARDHLIWVLELDPRRPLFSSTDQPIKLERQVSIQSPPPSPIYGVKEAGLGKGKDLLLTQPLDTWVPEARGSSARVFLGALAVQNACAQKAAIKVMRPDQIDYALPLFEEEVQILTLLTDVPGISPLLECGYILLDTNLTYPPDDRNANAEGLNGSVIRFGLDSIHNFLGDLEHRISQGWAPYLALELRERADNLLLSCDTGYTRGRFLPTLEGLRMGIQICEILEIAHSRNIVYRDHKILHYYWVKKYNSTFVIDWNIARRYPEGLTDADKQFDLVQFGARALHYVLTGRPAPGALPLGPNRPEDIESAARTYEVKWTYDDRRLPKEIKDLLAEVLSGSYTSASSLREDLIQVFQRLSKLLQNNQEVPHE